MNAIKTKQIISSGMTYSGIHDAVQRVLLSNKSFVLMYHRILNSTDTVPYYVQPGMYVTSKSFAQQLAFLKDNYDVIFLEDIVHKILNGESIGQTCAITFDDGWLDNYTEAYPLLIKYKVPATIFLSSGFVGTNKIFWPEELCCYLELFCKDKFPLRGVSASVQSYFDRINMFSNDSREGFFDKAINILKTYSLEDREKILTFFRTATPFSFPRQMMNWHEVNEMHTSGMVSFGSHTHNHVILDQVSQVTVMSEITKSLDEIENRLGIKVNLFAYPNGNFTESIQNVLVENGYLAAVTTRKGYFDHKAPLMAIPRIGIHEDVSSTLPLFRSRILFRKF